MLIIRAFGRRDICQSNSIIPRCLAKFVTCTTTDKCQPADPGVISLILAQAKVCAQSTG